MIERETKTARNSSDKKEKQVVKRKRRRQKEEERSKVNMRNERIGTISSRNFSRFCCVTVRVLPEGMSST